MAGNDQPYGNAERDAVRTAKVAVRLGELHWLRWPGSYREAPRETWGLVAFLMDMHKKDRKKWLKRA